MTPLHRERSPEAGYAMLLLLGILGIVGSVVLFGYSLGTKNQLAETQLALAQNQLRETSSSQIRLFDQWVRAGYLRADCSTGGLRPAADAPAHVKSRFSGGKFRIAGCDPNVLRASKGDSVFKSAGKALLPPECPTQPSELTTARVDDPDERAVVIQAKTAASKKSPLLGDIEPAVMKARLDLPAPPVPSFGLLVNDLHCGMCHVRVQGDVASTTAVTKFHENPGTLWTARVEGSWYAARTWNPSGGSPYIKVDVTGGVAQGYVGPKLPGKFVGSGGAKKFVPEFPKVNFATISSYKSPDPYTCSPRPLDTKAGNQVMIGTPGSPIRLKGDIHVRGDLVIKGWYEGVGTIYVDGNVYIPYDIRAKRSIFPYPTSPAAANKVAAESVKKKLHDGLAIATKRNIVIGEFDPQGRPSSSVWYHPLTPADKHGDKLGVMNVYAWYPGGKPAYDGLFETAFNCTNNSAAGHRGSINRIDAYLYAENTIGGLARKNSYAINGGIIADNFHVVSAASGCQSRTHPVHEMSMRHSHITYDYRMLHGLPLLDRFADYFMKQ